MKPWQRNLIRRLGQRLGHEGWRPRLTRAGRPLRLEAGGRLALSAAQVAVLGRPALIIKADDFGGPLNAAACDFVEAVVSVGGVAALGLITSRLGPERSVIASYQRLHEYGFELWLHGHRHTWRRPQAEFAGVGLTAQVESLATGLAVVRDRIGVGLRSFGAPGNAFDADTAAALGQFPGLRVWLYGDGPRALEAGALVLPRLAELEPEVGQVAQPEAFLAGIDTLMCGATPPEVVTLQAHPFEWSRRSQRRFATILRRLLSRFRLTTPDGWWRWVQDRDRIVVRTGTGEDGWVEARSATYRHVL